MILLQAAMAAGMALATIFGILLLIVGPVLTGIFIGVLGRRAKNQKEPDVRNTRSMIIVKSVSIALLIVAALFIIVVAVADILIDWSST